MNQLESKPVYSHRIFCTSQDWAKLQAETKEYLRTLPDAPDDLTYMAVYSCAFAFDKNANRAAGLARAEGLPGNFFLHLVNKEATYDAARHMVSYCDADSRVKLYLKILHL